jgi:hypothetical protein
MKMRNNMVIGLLLILMATSVVAFDFWGLFGDDDLTGEAVNDRGLSRTTSGALQGHDWGQIRSVPSPLNSPGSICTSPCGGGSSSSDWSLLWDMGTPPFSSAWASLSTSRRPRQDEEYLVVFDTKVFGHVKNLAAFCRGYYTHSGVNTNYDSVGCNPTTLYASTTSSNTHVYAGGLRFNRDTNTLYFQLDKIHGIAPTGYLTFLENVRVYKRPLQES